MFFMVCINCSSLKSPPQLWQIRSPRDFFCMQVRKPLLVCTITAFPQTRLAMEFPTLQNFYEGDVCKYREYWRREKMMMSGGLLGGRSRYQGDLQTTKNQRIKNARLQFDLWPPKIKRSGASEGNDQATFCQSKNLIAVANASTSNV